MKNIKKYINAIWILIVINIIMSFISNYLEVFIDNQLINRLMLMVKTLITMISIILFYFLIRNKRKEKIK